MPKEIKSGFTLVELLVVISIISILSVIIAVNFKDFSQDELSKKAISEIQTYLRTAQANATTSPLCDKASGVDWGVNFKTDKQRIELVCGPTNTIIKTLILDNLQLDSIEGSSCTVPKNLPLIVSFTALTGAVRIIGSDPCIGKSSKVTLNIKNLKSKEIKSFSISSGGAIDVE